MSKRHSDIEFAVDDPFTRREKIYDTWDEACGAAVSYALAGKPTHIDVLIYSAKGAEFYGGSAAKKDYLSDPDASVFTRLKIRVTDMGKVA